MAKKRMSDLKPPDWTAQLRGMGMSERSIKDMTFHPGDHDFFLAMNETFQTALTSEMKILIEDSLKTWSDTIKADVTGIVKEHTDQVNEVYLNMMRAIESLDKTTRGIATDVKKLNERQTKTEERITKEEVEIKLIKETLARKKERIDRIEMQMIQNQKDILEKIGDLEHDTKELALALDTDTTKANKAHRLKKYLIIILVAIALSSIVTFFALVQHGRNTRKMMEKVKIENPKVFVPQR